MPGITGASVGLVRHHNSPRLDPRDETDHAERVRSHRPGTNTRYVSNKRSAKSLRNGNGIETRVDNGGYLQCMAA